MRIRFQDLPRDTMARIERIVQDGGLGEGAAFIPVRRTWLAWMGVIALAVGTGSAWALATGAAASPRWSEAVLPYVGLIGLAYGAVALVEYLRILAAPLKPFILLTPFNLIKCGGSQHPLEIYRLAEANSFQRVEEYSGAKWQGQYFVFKFDGGHTVRFMLRHRQEIEAALRALDLARAAARGERLPDGPVRDTGDLRPGHLQALQRPYGLEQLLDPTSEFWLVTLGLLIIAMFVWAVFR
jgi:hypothetical protein